MKHFIKLITLVMILSVIMVAAAGCGNNGTDDSQDITGGENAQTYVSVNAVNGEGTYIDIEVPYYPTKIAFLDYVALDMCATLGILDNIEYIAVQDALPEYLANSVDSQVTNLGGLKGYQSDSTILTTIMEFQPELIFTSGRSAADYETFTELTADGGAVVSTSISYAPSTYQSFLTVNTRNASIFGLEKEMAEIISEYDARLEALQGWAEGQTAVMTIFTGGSMNLLGNESRCSMIFNDLGFENVGTDIDTSHGDAASYEALLLLDPDYIFVLDRDSAIATEGATSAYDLLNNEIIAQTTAWKEGNVIFLDPIVWYMVEGGVTAMDTMLSDLEVGMNK